MIKCQFCSKELKNPGAHKKHENACKKNLNRIYYKPPPGAGAKKGCIPWNKGLKNDPRCAHNIETKKKIAKTSLNRRHTPETKKKMSEQKKKLYASGWEATAGRCPKYDYNSPIAGQIKVDGSWELIFCQYADMMKFTWERNQKRFPYIKPNGQKSTYQPDFYIHELKSYIEVKGYETKLDKAKWSQFPEKLIILRKKEIKTIGKLVESGLLHGPAKTADVKKRPEGSNPSLAAN